MFYGKSLDEAPPGTDWGNRSWMRSGSGELIALTHFGIVLPVLWCIQNDSRLLASVR